jgi:hypothetical protein
VVLHTKVVYSWRHPDAPVGTHTVSS